MIIGCYALLLKWGKSLKSGLLKSRFDCTPHFKSYLPLAKKGVEMIFKLIFFFYVLFFCSVCEKKAKLIQYEVVHEIRHIVQRAQRIGKQSNAILQGESGSGKSTVLQQLEQLMQKQDNIYCHWINCKQFIGT